MQASNQRKVLIRKTTAVWLLQESEHVSSDQRFRVRSKQPHTCASESTSCCILLKGSTGTHMCRIQFLLESCVHLWITTRGGLDVYCILQNAQTKPVNTLSSTKGILLKYLLRILEYYVQCMTVPGSTRLFQISQCTLKLTCTVHFLPIYALYLLNVRRILRKIKIPVLRTSASFCQPKC